MIVIAMSCFKALHTRIAQALEFKTQGISSVKSPKIDTLAVDENSKEVLEMISIIIGISEADVLRMIVSEAYNELLNGNVYTTVQKEALDKIKQAWFENKRNTKITG